MHCYNCKDKLKTVFPDTPDGYEQWDNALIISLEGGYGMFVDDIPDDIYGNLPGENRNGYRIVICHECAHDLCDTVPFFKKLIDPHNSHSHSDKYAQENLNHYGWDYDWRENADKT